MPITPSATHAPQTISTIFFLFHAATFSPSFQLQIHTATNISNAAPHKANAISSRFSAIASPPRFLSYLVCPYLLINPSTRLPTNSKKTANELYFSLLCINASTVTTTTPARIPRNTLSLFAIRILQPAAINKIPDRIRENQFLQNANTASNTGIEIDNDTIIKTLTSLGFDAAVENDNFEVKVPSWRITKDVTIKADIIEDNTRIYGYDNFEINTASTPLYPIRITDEKSAEEKIKDILVKRFSLHELHSYIWQYADEYKALGMEVEDNIKLVSSANPNIETIRKSIVPTQLCQVSYNTGFAPEFGVFEIGRVCKEIKDDGLCDEKKELTITLFSKVKSLEKLYYDMRDMLAVCADDIKHAELTFESKKASHSYQHPKNLNKIFCEGKEIGEIGIVHPLVSAKIDKKANIVYAVIDVKAFSEIKNNSIHYEEVSRFPEMTIDLSFVTDKFAPIRAAVEKAKCEWIKKTGVIDIYNDGNSKSITVRLLFSHPERTLTGEEVKAVTDGIIEDLKSAGIALKLS